MEEDNQHPATSNGVHSKNDDQLKQKKMELLNKLPPINNQADKGIEEALNVYLGLMKQNSYSYNTNLKNNKNFSSIETINNTLQNFDIDQYGTNYPKELFDVTASITSEEFYDKLMNKHAGMQEFIQPNLPRVVPTAQQQADKNKKSLWDSTADPSGEDSRFGSIPSFLARHGNKL